jgi:hypothetical protein
MSRDIYKKHPLKKCNVAMYSICILMLLQFIILISIIGGAIFMYVANPGIVKAVSDFPWVEAGKDATRMYNSIRSYDARGTLDNATFTVNMLKHTMSDTTGPLQEIKDFIHSAWQDKDIFDKVHDILDRLYKPLKRFEDGQEDIIELIHHINDQLKHMQSNEIHQVAAKIIQVIGGIELSMTEENIQIFKNAAFVFTDKLNQTDVKIFNKVMAQTDFSIEKINSIFKP